MVMVKIMNCEFKIMNWRRAAWTVLAIVAVAFTIHNSKMVLAQQPQAPAGTPIYSANAKYVNGMAPGYWPTAGSGLTLNLSAGSAVCDHGTVTYTGGSLTMAAGGTNYVYLDLTNSCTPASNTTGFSDATVPIAVVTTSGSAISTIKDTRTWFQGERVNGNVAHADRFAGADACAKIAAAFATLPSTGGVVDARGLNGNQPCATNPLGGAPPNSTLLLGQAVYQTSVTWSTPSGGLSPMHIVGINPGAYGVNNGTVIQATTALNPVLDIQDDRSYVEFLNIDGGGLATTGILARTSRTYSAGHATNISLNQVSIEDMASTATGLDLDAADALHGCSDCSFHDVGIFGPLGTGIKIAREDNQFYFTQVVGARVGVDFIGPTNFGISTGNAFYGGVFSGNVIDITTESFITEDAFYSVWFENATTGIIAGIPSGTYTDQGFSFYNCHMSDDAGVGNNLMDLTNMAGSVTLFRCVYDIFQAKNIVIPGSAQFNDYASSNTSALTFSGGGRRYLWQYAGVGGAGAVMPFYNLFSSDNTGEISLTPSTANGPATIGFGSSPPPSQSQFSFDSSNMFRNSTGNRPQINTYYGLEIHGGNTSHGPAAYNTGSSSDPSLSVYSPGSGQLAMQLHGGEAQTINAVAFSTAPTFDASLGNIQTITLTGNVSSSTLSNCSAGEVLVFDIIQDAAGSRTFAWPSNVLNAGTIGSTAGKHNIAMFYCDGTNARAISPMLTNQN